MTLPSQTIRALCYAHISTCRVPRSYLIKVKIPGVNDKPLVALSMEVCEIQSMDLRGIKLKRLKGDVWQYKRVRPGGG